MENQGPAVIVSLGGISTLDDRLQLPPEEVGKLNIDARSAALTRARAVLLLLHCNGEEAGGFELNHGHVMDALWCVDGLITQAQSLVDQVEIIKTG